MLHQVTIPSTLQVYLVRTGIYYYGTEADVLELQIILTATNIDSAGSLISGTVTGLVQLADVMHALASDARDTLLPLPPEVTIESLIATADQIFSTINS